MRILVTGTKGQIAQALAEQARSQQDIELIALGRPQLDLARPATIAPAIQAAKPDLVVNAAAYTAVDQAEDEPELAHVINGIGAGAVAKATAELGVPIIQISTDYVFDGTLDRPYTEDDQVNPLGAYGRSKLEGEQLVAEANPKHLIIRTAWVYSPYGKNFVKTMLRLAETRDEVSVVADQIGNPTSAGLIADGLIAIAHTLKNDPDFNRWGVFHLASSGALSWADFAAEIFQQSGKTGGPAAKVAPIATSDYPTKAARPANSRLEFGKFASTFDFAPRPWQKDLAAVIGMIRNIKQVDDQRASA